MSSADGKDAWEATQKRTFTKWFNNHLQKKGFPLITDPETDFETGIKLMQIVNALYDKPIPKHNANPKLRPNKLDNIDLALKMVEEAKIKTNFLKHTHLVDKDLKMILGMMWAIILDYAIKGISEEDMSAKEGLLLWCRKKTAGYNHIDPPGISNFTSNWRNGLALCALIHRHQPQLLNYEELNPANAAENVELAFSLAEKNFNIPRLLEVEDLVTDKPDERSVMTYIAEWFHCFANQDRKETAARRAKAFVVFQQRLYDQQKSYEAEAEKFLASLAQATSSYNNSQFENTFDDAQSQIQKLREFILQENPALAAQKLDLEANYTEIQTQLKVNGRPSYEAPSNVTPDALEEAYNKFYAAQQQYSRRVRDYRFGFIKKQETSSLSAEEVQELRDNFKHFDHDHDNLLNKTEFKAAASAVGVSFKDDNAFNQNFATISGNGTGITEEQWIAYLTNMREDKDTPEQIKESFKILADDGEGVRKEQLNIPPLSAEDVEHLLARMEQNADGSYNFNAFVESSFSKAE